MNSSDIKKKTFNAQLSKAFTGIYKQYAVFASHCLIRLGFEPTINLMGKTLLQKTDYYTSEILNYGWMPSEAAADIEKEKKDIISANLPDSILRIETPGCQNLVDQFSEMYPLNQMIVKFRDELQLECKLTAYEYLHLVFDGYAKLIEALIKEYNKEGELIAYDIERKIRLSNPPKSCDNDIKQFMKDFAFLENSNDLLSIGLSCTLKKVTENEVVKDVNECAWARYFRDHHPDVGYLIACSTDETEYLNYNKSLRMRRTKTLMEGGDCCDFHVFVG